MSLKRSAIVVFLSFLFVFGCETIGPIKYVPAEQPVFYYNGWKIEFVGISYGNRVNGKFFGDQFVYAQFLATNETGKHSKFFLQGKNLNEENWDWIMKHNRSLRSLYESNPDSVDKENFIKKTPGIKLRIRKTDPAAFIPSIYHKMIDQEKADNPPPSQRTEFYATGAGGHSDRLSARSMAETPWLAPGESHLCKFLFSIPDGTEPIYILWLDQRTKLPVKLIQSDKL